MLPEGKNGYNEPMGEVRYRQLEQAKIFLKTWQRYLGASEIIKPYLWPTIDREARTFQNTLEGKHPDIEGVNL